MIMKKNISFTFFLLFLFANSAHANIGFHNFTSSYTHYVPFIPIVSFIEAFIFWILTEALLLGKVNGKLKKKSHKVPEDTYRFIDCKYHLIFIWHIFKAFRIFILLNTSFSLFIILSFSFNCIN